MKPILAVLVLALVATIATWTWSASRQSDWNVSLSAAAYDGWPVVYTLAANGRKQPSMTAQGGAETAGRPGASSHGLIIPTNGTGLILSVSWRELRTGRVFEADITLPDGVLQRGRDLHSDLSLRFGAHGDLTLFGQTHRLESLESLLNLDKPMPVATPLPEIARLCGERTALDAVKTDPIEEARTREDLILNADHYRSHRDRPEPEGPCPDPGR